MSLQNLILNKIRDIDGVKFVTNYGILFLKKVWTLHTFTSMNLSYDFLKKFYKIVL